MANLLESMAPVPALLEYQDVGDHITTYFGLESETKSASGLPSVSLYRLIYSCHDLLLRGLAV